MSKPLKILIAEDNPADAKLVLRTLKQAGLEFEVQQVDNESDYVKFLRPDLDIILSDFEMPQFSATRALEVVVERELDIPFIIISGTIGEDQAVAAMKKGAHDYLLKDRLGRLGPAVIQAVEQGRMRKERRRAEEALRESEELFRQVVQNIEEVFWMTNVEKSEMLFVSAGYQKIWGRTCASLHESPTTWLQAIHPDDRERVLHSAKTKQVDGSYSEEYRIVRPDGSIRWINDRAFPVRDSNGSVYRVAGVAQDITARREAEEAVRGRLAVEERLSLLAATAPGIIYAFRRAPDGRLSFPYASPRLLDMLGVAPEDVIEDAKPSLDFVHPEDYGEVIASIAQSARNLTVWAHDFRFNHPGKGPIWLEGRSVPIREADGGTLWHGFLLDVTDRKEAESTLRLQSAALESAANGILIADRSGTIRQVNRALEAMTGYSAKELVGEKVSLLESGGHSRSFNETIWKTVLEGKVWRGELTNQRRDGSEYVEHITITPVYDQQGEIAHCIAIKEDVTDRKRSEERVHEQAAMLNLAQDAIIVRNFADRTITFWNEGAARLYGWSSEEALGKNIGQLIFRDAKKLDELGEALSKTGEWRGESQHVGKDGRKLTVSTRATLVYDGQGQPKSVLVINTDITQQKELEARFLRAQRMESIGTLASGVAHDLNNILSPIMMSIPMLRWDLGPEQREEIIETIEISADRGAQIIKQVLTFGRGLEGERHPLKISSVIKEILKIMRETFPKDIVVDSSFAPDLWLVVGDATQLHQVVLNLCVNARDAMTTGGKIWIEANNLMLDENYASMIPGASTGPHVLVEVKDSGDGIPPEILDRIFDPFFTTKGVGQGTGLGLSTVLGIVKSHGGHINVKSEAGVGTTFQIYLPAVREKEALARLSELVEESPRGQGECILLVDDEEKVRKSTQLVLQSHGYTVLAAADGAEALVAFSKNSNTIALVLTDLMMPFMDGIALIHVLRKTGSALPIIASTGLGKKTQLAELEALNAKLLPKPYNAQALLNEIHDSLHKDRPRTKNGAADPAS